MAGAEAFKIELNQNLWGLIASFAALGAAEHYCLCLLKIFAVISSTIMIISLGFTVYWYTWKYIKNKQKEV